MPIAMKKRPVLSLTIMLFLLLGMFVEPALNKATAGVFKVTRLQVYFANQRAETVVEKNSPSLKAYADLSIEGTGLLQGFWEVNGRVMANVTRHIATERSTITLETPDLPGIPTFESGPHRLRFVLTSPALTAILPEAIYFVAGRSVKPLAMKTTGPAPDSVVPYGPTIFRWAASEGSSAYLITFFSTEEKPVFSAYTRDLDYKLSKVILENTFVPGQEYFWKVVSFGEGQNRLGASDMNKFKFKD